MENSKPGLSKEEVAARESEKHDLLQGFGDDGDDAAPATKKSDNSSPASESATSKLTALKAAKDEPFWDRFDTDKLGQIIDFHTERNRLTPEHTGDIDSLYAKLQKKTKEMKARKAQEAAEAAKAKKVADVLAHE